MIPERVVNTASVGKLFVEKEQNILGQKNYKAHLSIEQIGIYGIKKC